MPISTVSTILQIDDAKVAKLAADTSAALTYATSVDVPGIREIGATKVIDHRTLDGDNKRLAAESRVRAVDLSVKNAKVSLDALAVILGGAVAGSGVTPNQKQTYTLLGADKSPYFKLEGQSKSTTGDSGDVADAHVVWYKCKVTGGEYAIGEDYAIVSFAATAIPTVKDDKIEEIVFNETATAIA